MLIGRLMLMTDALLLEQPSILIPI